MLFIKSTEAGIQLESATILTTENLNKALIPANNNRIKEWARDNHVDVSINPQVEHNDFNLLISMTLDKSTSEPTLSASKKMLKHTEKELIEFISAMPDNADDAADEAIICNEVDKICKKFTKDIQAIAGKDVFVSIRIFKLRDHGTN